MSSDTNKYINLGWAWRTWKPVFVQIYFDGGFTWLPSAHVVQYSTVDHLILKQLLFVVPANTVVKDRASRNCEVHFIALQVKVVVF